MNAEPPHPFAANPDPAHLIDAGVVRDLEHTWIPGRWGGTPLWSWDRLGPPAAPYWLALPSIGKMPKRARRSSAPASSSAISASSSAVSGGAAARLALKRASRVARSG